MENRFVGTAEYAEYAEKRQKDGGRKIDEEEIKDRTVRFSYLCQLLPAELAGLFAAGGDFLCGWANH
jgi:hypothetical protein